MMFPVTLRAIGGVKITGTNQLAMNPLPILVQSLDVARAARPRNPKVIRRRLRVRRVQYQMRTWRSTLTDRPVTINAGRRFAVATISQLGMDA